MGFWDRLFGRSSVELAERSGDVAQTWYGFGSHDAGVPLSDYRTADVEALWSSQANVRKVVGFAARNAASVPLHLYERLADGSPRRVRDHPLARLLSTPALRTGAFRFWEAVLSDGLLYDRWCVLLEARDDGTYGLAHLPSRRLKFTTDSLRRVVKIEYRQTVELASGGTREEWCEVDLDTAIFDYGYAPRTAGLTPMDTLRDALAETAEAVRFRRQVWQNGARNSGYIERPANAAWSPEARRQFVDGFRASYTGNGEGSGGWPLLEDGMKLHSMDAFSPQDTQDLEGRQLTAIEVAAAYYIAPELVGARQGNYANVDAFRQMLYRDSLGPYITAWEQALNAMLTPLLAGDRDLYIEAHMDAKLRGSFQEQGAIMSTSTGRPWLTTNEGRARFNLPPIDGGDELVTPLNVLIGGQASPRDSGSQNLNTGPRLLQKAPSEPVRIKAEAREEDARTAEAVLSRFFKRQSKAVLARLGAKDSEFWDEDRWDSELADDLYALAVEVSEQVAKSTLDALGVDPDVYSVERTMKFLRAVAESRAKAINATTLAKIEAALAGDIGEEALTSTPAGVFEEAESSRAAGAGVTLATTLAAFAVTESAKQMARPSTTKTWDVQSGNPRASHARMNGETVGIEETFSNGMSWPGDPSGGADEVANCLCGVTVSIP